MTEVRFVLVALSIAITWTWPATSLAQEESEAELLSVSQDLAVTTPNGQSKAAADTYGLNYANRKLTMPQGMIRVTFDVNVFRINLFGVGRIVSLNFGAAIAPVDNLEIGFSRYRPGGFPGINFLELIGVGAQGLASGIVKPGTDFGDIPFYIRYQIASGSADAVLEFRVRIPTLSELGFGFGIPVRFHLGGSAAIDTGIDVTYDDPKGAKVVSLGAPLEIVGNVSEQAFLKFQTGVSLPDFGTDLIAVFPFGVTIGGSTPAGSSMIDLFAAFRFPVFGAIGSGGGDVTTEIWTLTFGINLHTPVLF